MAEKNFMQNIKFDGNTRRGAEIQEYSGLRRRLYAKGTIGDISIDISRIRPLFCTCYPSLDLDLFAFGFVLPNTRLAGDRPHVQ
jgi:hypothetical protein